jgi:hypothetical protein
MRRPRKPVSPNTVTMPPFVATITQIRQFMSSLHRNREQRPSETEIMAVGV